MAISIRKVQEKKDPSISHWISRAYSHVFSAEACLCPRGTKCGQETMERTFITLLPFFFSIIAIITRIPSGSFCGWERQGAPERRNPKWLGCRRCGLALFAGSHCSLLEENSWFEPTLCQCVALPSVFFVFFPLWKGTATYAKLPSFYAFILSFYAKHNTDICQWSTQFYLQYPFVMNMYFGAFRFFK